MQVGIPIAPLIELNKHHLTDSEGSNSTAFNNNNNINAKPDSQSASTSKSKLKLNDGRVGGKLSSSAKSSRNKKTKGRVKIKMEYIENKIRRYTTFSKRKTGIMKKVNSWLSG